MLSLFNVVTDYDAYTKTVTLNLFEKLKAKTPVDLSPYVEVEDVDYSDFISNYGKSTTLSYQASNDEDLSAYNVANFIKYGAASITVDNDFLPDTAALVDNKFTAPVSYINSALDCSVERVNFVELEDDTVYGLPGVARIAVLRGARAAGEQRRRSAHANGAPCAPAHRRRHHQSPLPSFAGRRPAADAR